MKWPSAQVRRAFVDYFVQNHGHQFVPSSSVVPNSGDGLYFCNSGMNQFKQLFFGNALQGSKMADYRRVVNHQKCIRVGGKHNDLMAVGKDLYHHTFFEMLGNWSFSDYYKEDACSMALDLLTRIYGIPKHRLYVTYFGGDEQLGLKSDQEVYDIWIKLGFPPSRILPFGMHDNFWEMGTTGPCGPCTEIHYDHVGNGRDASSLVNKGSHDVTELWNIVFMQYDRQGQTLNPLSTHHVDTGMGFERLVAVLQDKRSNYDTDLFTPLFDHIHQNSKVASYQGHIGHEVDVAYRLVADHSRMMTIAIADGLVPSVRGIGHKLRSIIHRCLKASNQVLKTEKGFIVSLVDVVSESLGEAYPEVVEQRHHVKDVLSESEEHYLKDIDQQNKIYHDIFSSVNGDLSQALDKEIQLLIRRCPSVVQDQTIISEIARARGLKHEEQDTGKLETKFSVSKRALQYLHDMGHVETCDVSKYSYHKDELSDLYQMGALTSEVIAVLADGELVGSISGNKDAKYSVITKETNFYSEAGGQVADEGLIICEEGEFQVEDVQKHGAYILHVGICTKGYIKPTMKVALQPDMMRRTGCMRNHTATHLLLMALRRNQCNVSQRGSFISPEKLTFDFFTQRRKDMNEEIAEVESFVRKKIKEDITVKTFEVTFSEAVKMIDVQPSQSHVYPCTVKVISIGSSLDEAPTSDVSSNELCGGTHVANTGDIKDFCITRYRKVGQDTVRITAVTHDAAEKAWSNFEGSCELLKLAAVSTDPILTSTYIKQIDQIVNCMDFPKTKLVVFQKELLKTKMNMKRTRNLESFEDFVLKLQGEVESKASHPFVNCSLDFSGPKQVISAVRQLKVDKPVSVSSQHDRKLMCILYLPQNCLRSDANAVLRSILRRSKTSYCKTLFANQYHDFYSVLENDVAHYDTLISAVQSALKEDILDSADIVTERES